MTSEIQPRESPADPWTEIDRAFDSMHRRFAESFGIVPIESFETEVGLRSPRADVTDTGTAYKVVAEIPGIPKEKLDIRVRGTSVEVRGENATESEQKEEHYLHRERTFAGFYRAFELPEPVVAAQAKAKVVNGVLEL
ncbi:MAG TPA: Hsp20/alpha crystallin family protein, partial [Thermoplasmata archaeon]|nr:Hsp20/alpha crystallin family protein [Thermoplasmata archaeon]